MSSLEEVDQATFATPIRRAPSVLEFDVAQTSLFQLLGWRGRGHGRRVAADRERTGLAGQQSRPSAKLARRRRVRHRLHPAARKRERCADEPGACQASRAQNRTRAPADTTASASYCAKVRLSV